MKKWVVVIMSLSLTVGCASLPPNPPEKKCPASCPMGTACTDPAKGCQPIPPPGPVCENGIDQCGCFVMPPETGEWTEIFCPAGQTCEAKRCVAAPAPVCPTCAAGFSCSDPATGCVKDPVVPPPSAGCSIDGEPGPEMSGYKPVLGNEVNEAMSSLKPSCSPGSRCVITDGRQAWQARVIAELKRRGRCSGQHAPTTDEIAVSTGISQPREGWHVYAGPDSGPGTVVWSPGAVRPTYSAPGGPPPEPPQATCTGCPAPCTPKVARWGLTYRNRWWDCTPQFYGKDTATWTGVPVNGYCAAIGMSERLYCPARQEGDPNRRACEGVGLGGYAAAVPLWRCEQGQPEVNESNPFQARCDAGWIEVCATDGTSCTRSDS